MQLRVPHYVVLLGILDGKILPNSGLLSILLNIQYATVFTHTLLCEYCMQHCFPEN